MKLLNIYGQYDNHTEAKIIGNSEGLTALKEAIERALRNGKASTEQSGSHVNPDGKVIGESDALFASDGEGYEVLVERHNGCWGMEEDGAYNRKRFWNSERSRPQYRMWDLMQTRQETFQELNLDYFAGELSIGKRK